MSPVTRESLSLKLKHQLARLKYRHAPQSLAGNDAAFRKYFHELLYLFKQPEIPFTITATRQLASKGEGLGIFEIRFKENSGQAWQPGDLVYLRWQNSPERIEAIKDLLGQAPSSPYRTWDYGTAFQPPSLCNCSPEVLLREILDLQVASPALTERARRLNPKLIKDELAKPCLLTLLKACPQLARWETLMNTQARIKPRLYTVSRISNDGRDEIEIILSTIRQSCSNTLDTDLGRCGAYLSQAPAGTVIPGYRLPHPHRLPLAYGYGGPGVCIVTGSAITGLLVFLRAGRIPPGLWVIWGMGARAETGIYEQELNDYLAAGTLTRLDFVESRPQTGEAQYVQAFIASHTEEMNSWLKQESWFYVSGQHKMAHAVREVLAKMLVDNGDCKERLQAEKQISAWQQQMRYVESTAG